MFTLAWLKQWWPATPSRRPARPTRPGRFRWGWHQYTCQANTKSEARGNFKRVFCINRKGGLDRLPVGANIVKVTP